MPDSTRDVPRDPDGEGLLDELRALANRGSATDHQGLQLANGLYNAHTVVAALGHGELAGRLLNEVRALADRADPYHALRLLLNSALLHSRGVDVQQSLPPRGSRVAADLQGALRSCPRADIADRAWMTRGRAGHLRPEALRTTTGHGTRFPGEGSMPTSG